MGWDKIERRKDTEHCLYEERWGRVLNQLEHFSNKFCKHIDEGEEKGGFRDRLIILEQTICTLKKSYWKTALTCGIIGGLVGKLTPDIFNFLIKTVFAFN